MIARWTASVVVTAIVVLLGAGCQRSVDSADSRPSALPSTSTTSASASLSTTTTTELHDGVALGETTLSCEQAVQQPDPIALLQAFRRARLNGHGAEGCLSVEALSFYCRANHPCAVEDFDRDPGPGCLYECPDSRLVDVSLYQLSSAPPTYILRIDRDDGGPRGGTGAEGVTIGAGRPVGGSNAL